MKHPAFDFSPARRLNRGFTLTELVIVIGVAGIILGAIWVAAGAVKNGNNVNQAAQELQTVSQNFLTLYQNRTLPASCIGVGSADLTGVAINNGVVPSAFVATAGACGTANNPWATATQSFAIYSVAGNVFRLSFYDVPRTECISLLLQATGCDPSQAGCPVAIHTGGIYGTVGGNTLSAVGTPKTWMGTMTTTQATNLCGFNANPGAGNNSVEFDFQM